jgi:geranylgeranyl pyrophosphate synthase
MDFDEYLEKSATEINRELMNFFPKKVTRSWVLKNLSTEEFSFDIEAYQKAVAEPIWNFMERGGKRWRPALLLLCCEAVGGKRKKALPYAVLPELAHNGTIIVDDVEDSSPLRRGKPTLHLLYGIDTAVNAGNLLYFLPLALLFNKKQKLPEKITVRLYNVFSEEMLRLSFGQATDIYWHHGKKNTITENQYLQMCIYKTGSLARMAAKCGAILGGANEKKSNLLGNYAASIGVAFQIQDDILNIMPSSGKWGKELGEDISEGKRSLLVVYALNNSKKEKAKRLSKILALRTTEKEQIIEAIEIIKESGAVEYAERKAQAIVKTSWLKVEKELPESRAKNLLKSFGDYLINRKI